MKKRCLALLLVTMACAGVFAQEQPVGRTYNIGDTGPAGGIVFYDKGTFSDGWRYLEAAPAETEFTAEWGAYGTDVSGTETEVGTGRRNTEIIVGRLEGLGETGRAAQLCADLNFGGVDDWFLPSKDELDLMYKNLKAKDLGGFSNNLYWSSSQNGYHNSWFQYFIEYLQASAGKDLTLPVRAIRAF